MRIGYKKLVSAVKRFAILSLCIPFITTTANAAPAGTIADKYAAIVVDANTGKTLFEFNANARRYPASLTKMMTLYMLFEAMEQGRISPKTPIRVSAYAVSRPPTKIGFKPGQTITVEEAAKALITKSANDVASAIAEYLGGSEAQFARMMTTKARKLGMMNTNFTNASGLPDVRNYSTARDMAILSIALREHFPKRYYLFSTTSFTYRGKTINGHNRLLKTMKGVDGIKTGYVGMSGYNLATSIRANGKSLVGVVMGGRTAAQRDAHMAELLNRFMPKASVSRRGPVLSAAATSSPAASESVEQTTTIASNTQSLVLPTGNSTPIPVAKLNLKSSNNDAIVTALITPDKKPTKSADATSNALKDTNDTQSQNINNSDIDPVITASAPQRSSGNGKWAIQIGSLPSKQQALTLLDKAATSNVGRSTLSHATAEAQSFEKNSKRFYRARFTGFKDQESASQACSKLKKADFNCYAIAQ